MKSNAAVQSVSQLTCLLGTQEFVIHCFDCDGSNFSRVLSDVWKQIPKDTQSIVFDYWKQYGGLFEPPIRPFFALKPDLPLDTYGQVSSNGMELKFSSKAFEVLPDSITFWIVAHELAHVYEKAIGMTPGDQNETDNERHADLVAQEWGFCKNSYLAMSLILQTNPGITLELAGQNVAQLSHRSAQ